MEGPPIPRRSARPARRRLAGRGSISGAERRVRSVREPHSIGRYMTESGRPAVGPEARRERAGRRQRSAARLPAPSDRRRTAARSAGRLRRHRQQRLMTRGQATTRATPRRTSPVTDTAARVRRARRARGDRGFSAPGYRRRRGCSWSHRRTPVRDAGRPGRRSAMRLAAIVRSYRCRYCEASAIATARESQLHRMLSLGGARTQLLGCRRV